MGGVLMAVLVAVFVVFLLFVKSVTFPFEKAELKEVDDKVAVVIWLTLAFLIVIYIIKWRLTV